MSMRSLPHRLLLTALLSLFSALGCSSSDDDEATHGGGPLYAVMYEVIDDVGSTSYLSLLDSVDITEVDRAKAREFSGGRAFVQAYDGALFVGAAETPTVTRYSVAADGKLVPEGELSFANYGLDQGQFDAWNVTFLTRTSEAYLMNFKEDTTIIWDPTTMKITGDIPAPAELHREGLSLEGSPAVVRDGLFFAPSTGSTTTTRTIRRLRARRIRRRDG
ncbi:MAG: hypothetical protein QM756_21590 [Polyangiaceae bacterium]